MNFKKYQTRNYEIDSYFRVFNSLQLKMNKMSSKPNSKNRIKIKIISSLISVLLLFFISPDAISQSNSTLKSFGEDITAKKFFDSTIDNNNVVWFLTESGIISFDGTTWSLHNKNSEIAGKEFKDFVFDSSGNKNEMIIASPDGAIVAATPLDESSKSAIFTPDNSKINSKNVLGVSVSKNALQWFGTENGISAFNGSSWLENDYDDRYPEDIFKYFPFSTMAASNSGDSLYVGTDGGGVMRFYKNDVDAISGASEFAIWGPIQMPSDNVFSVYIAPDGSQWIGTDEGVAKHVGHNALEGWTIIDKKTGLADNKVQAISSDSKGNLYFGTANGLSVYDGENLTNYTTENGMVNNNILTIAIDNNDIAWLGTENGVSCLKNGEFVNYQ